MFGCSDEEGNPCEYQPTIVTLNASLMLVTLLTSQVGIAPYSLPLHIPSTGFADKQEEIAVRKLLSVIGVCENPRLEPKSKSRNIRFILVE